MAGGANTWMRLLLLFILLSFTQQFELTDDEWMQLGPDVAALHRLQGLHQRMFHQRLGTPANHRSTSSHGVRVQRSSSSVDVDQNTRSLREDLQECKYSFTECVIQMAQDFDDLLAAIDDQKIQDWLLSASEISHSYNQKLLVMTDDDTSTLERVQHEFSLDPRYSVIVSHGCLSNASCVPAADSHTVVKVFGRVSDDGQTLSGLSGSSLAQLMLTPPLEAAQVFSLDGNTTTTFQHNFLHLFVVRGVKAVLETKQGSQQVYQAMKQPDSVSSYQIPERKVDHTTQYDHQQIIVLENDPVVNTAAINLYEKHPKVSSIYALDENKGLRLIRGTAKPLTEDSRLVLVGHGTRGDSGETRVGGFNAQEVTEIVQKTSRAGDKIKTTSVVACEVGSDKAFVESLLKGLDETAGIKTELHVRDAVLQVQHTGEKITQEITKEGVRWRHKDDSKKVVATLDRNGNVVLRDDPGSKGEAVFTTERNVLPAPPRDRFLKFKETGSWPMEPRSFINQEAIRNVQLTDQNRFGQMKNTLDGLEALSWGIFHAEQPLPSKVNTENVQLKGDYVIWDKHGTNQWIKSEEGLKNILDKCYEIKSGEDVRNIIRHYGKTGEQDYTYLKVKDWIYSVDPENLYVYPVGKKLDQNQRGNNAETQRVKQCIYEQINQERYPNMQQRIFDQNIEKPRENYAQFVRDVFRGEHTIFPRLSTEAWYTTHFIASVISESARNFRTFPLVLMALDMARSSDSQIREQGLNFLLTEHSMARGESWIDPSRRGFSGSATPKDSSKLENTYRRRSEGDLMDSLKELLTREFTLTESWAKGKDILPEMLNIAGNYKVTAETETIKTGYESFKEKVSSSEPAASGALGGYSDGHIAPRDVRSAAGLENSLKMESHFSRAKSLLSEQIQRQMKAEYGEGLAGLRLQDGSARIENGQFVCHLVSERVDAQPVEFRVDMSAESRRYSENMMKSVGAAAHDMERHGSASPHEVSEHVERAGHVMSAVGFMVGMKGAVTAFEHGDIKDGVMGSLQTAHGAVGMATSAIAKQAMSAETSIAKAAGTLMKSRVMKGTMAVLPVVGFGFGIYNIVEDFKRKDTLGYIDAALDITTVLLDVVEMVQPELAPFIAPINLVLSAVRMLIDDVFMSIQNKLNSLPKDAGLLEKLVAGLEGFVEGLVHFEIRVASFFYDWRYEEIEEGHRLVAQISDYRDYYKVVKQTDGTTAIDFSSGGASWNGGGIDFCLADQGQSELCMDYFVSGDEDPEHRCWRIDTDDTKDIILGMGESHELEHTTLQKKVLMFIPAGWVTVVSGYDKLSYSRYGKYTGNKYSNRFFAIQKADDDKMIELMLSYYYNLHGLAGDDIFFLGPQRSFVRGSAGKDTYIVPKDGGKTIIDNYDPSKEVDTLHFSVAYRHISVTKSADDVVLMYEGSHTVTIQGWFSGELFRHMNMMSGDGVVFDISPIVLSSVKLEAKGINKMFKTEGETVDASETHLRTVTTIFGTQGDDVIIGNDGKNLIDGGGGRDRLIGGEGEDVYSIKNRRNSAVRIENLSRDAKTDLAIIEANLHSFSVRVEGDDVILNPFPDNMAFSVILVRWFRSEADRHLLVITKDLITFKISDNIDDCLLRDPFTKCIKSLRIDYSSSSSSLAVDLQEDEALESVTEIRGSKFSDVIKGNKEHNVLIPGGGSDFLQGRGGEDWYVITPGQGVKTINNHSPDRVLDVLHLQEQYERLACSCEGQSIVMSVNNRKEVVLQDWFTSKNHQHLQIKTSDGVTAGLMANQSSCGGSLLLPLVIDYRDQKPVLLNVTLTEYMLMCFKYTSKGSKSRSFCGFEGKVMMMSDAESVKEMYGSSGFDIMVGNRNENLLDPHTGGALMSGGEGKDTYIIKHRYGSNMEIDNFAEDQNVDTVQVDMDFLDGSEVTLESWEEDLNVKITAKGENLRFMLLNFNDGPKYQHIEFQSSDGVSFKLKPRNSTGDVPAFDIEAFKVTLKESQVDCHVDLNALKNLSKVHTVQGCPSQSNGIMGNAVDNALIGGWKDDTLDGGRGDDTLVGGQGDDILVGGLGDDTLYGEDGKDTMMGNSGSDIFVPGPGADLVDGGAGKDTVVYRGDHDTGTGVYVNLLTGQGRYADAEEDVLKDVEIVIGSIYPDILVSGYESSLLQGSDGNDILVSTGSDYLVGGEGNDIYMLAFDHGSVAINNCAKDKETDVLYLSSRSTPKFEHQRLSDKLLLTFVGFNQTTVKLTLDGWSGDDSECGHLKVVFGEMEISVEQLISGCERG